ncbi:homeobox-domain-containing protein [Ceratobasidium sp. AG-I]|nr:homeobox-domain-containing protein [Ceratobasidium sp. AG-I]
MSQRPGDHTHGEQSSGWETKEHQVPGTQVEPGTASPSHDERHVQERLQTLGDPHSTLQAWYQTRNTPAAELAYYSDPTSIHPGPVAAVHPRPNTTGPEHMEWPERPVQPSADFPYRSHQYTPYPPTYGESRLIQTAWTSGQYEGSSSEHGYLAAHPHHFSQDNSAHDYTTNPPPARSARRYSPLATGVDQGRQNRFATLQPLQSAPYVPSVPPSPREGSSFVHSPADPSSSPHAYLPYAELDQHGSRAFVRTAEPLSRVVETPQFIVPSSRVPRAEPSPYSPISSQSATSPASDPSQLPTETKPKRRRANAAQLSLLNDTYSRTMFPTTEERAEIARRINMTPRQVQIWFQNRRQASRQQQSPAPLPSPGLGSQGSQEPDLNDDPAPDVNAEDIE